MKLQTNTAIPEMANVEHQGNFKIKSSAKAFSILSSGLYSNKIKAVIRELSCNALDSHVEAGKADVPFDVHLPNAIEPYFSVRDYGVGLSHESVLDIYTTYFESTKTDSNDYIGALGLGSKSPFSYTDNFTVTAIYDGVKRIYTAYINEFGCPSIALMGTSEVGSNTEGTEEDLVDALKCSNGVEVKFPVTDNYDFNRFTSEATEIFSWFNTKPNVRGNSYYSHREHEFDQLNIIPGVHLKFGRGGRATAVQGNIAYDINFPLPDEHRSLQKLFNLPFVMHFELGELDVSASREGLSYIEMTTNNIIAKMYETKEKMYQHFLDQVSVMEEGWEKANALKKFANSPAFEDSAVRYVREGKCNLLTLDNFGSMVSNLRFTEKEVTDMGVKIDRIRFQRTYRSGSYRYTAKDIGYDKDWEKDEFFFTVSISNSNYFVLNDLPRGPVSRIKSHYRENSNGDSVVYLIRPIDGAPDDAVNTFLDKIYNPITVKVSELDIAEKEAVFRAGFLYLDYVDISRQWYSNEKEYRYQRITHDLEIDPAETYYYFPAKALSPELPNGELLNMHSLWEQVVKVGFFSKDSKIYGVRKSQIKNVVDLPNWVNLFDLLTEKVSNFDTEILINGIYRDIVDTRIYDHCMVESAKELPDDSDFKKYVSEVDTAIKASTSKSSESLRSLKIIAEKIGCEFSFDKTEIQDRLRADEQRILKKYPMFKLALCGNDFTSTDVKQVMEYIKIVDNMESENE